MPDTVRRHIWEWMMICATASIGLGLAFGVIWVATVQGSGWAWWQMILAALLSAIGFGVIAPLGFIASMIMSLPFALPYGSVETPKKGG